MQRLQHQLRVLHSANGRPGGDHLWERINEDQPARHQLYGIRICHPAAYEPAGFTHSARKDEVDVQMNKLSLNMYTLMILRMIDNDFKLLCVPLCLSVCLQSDPQYCHAGNKAGPGQIQHCPGPCTGRNIQQTVGLHGD